MIARMASATVMVAAGTVTAIAGDKQAMATMRPTVWHFLGYAFEAGPMIVALVACVAVRYYVVQKDYAAHRWSLDLPVGVLALLFTATAVVRVQPDLIGAASYGTVFGILGAGIIAIAKKNVDRMLAALGLSEPKA